MSSLVMMNFNGLATGVLPSNPTPVSIYKIVNGVSTLIFYSASMDVSYVSNVFTAMSVNSTWQITLGGADPDAIIFGPSYGLQPSTGIMVVVAGTFQIVGQ